jgi:hypothetical protein
MVASAITLTGGLSTRTRSNSEASPCSTSRTLSSFICLPELKSRAPEGMITSVPVSPTEMCCATSSKPAVPFSSSANPGWLA